MSRGRETYIKMSLLVHAADFQQGEESSGVVSGRNLSAGSPGFSSAELVLLTSLVRYLDLDLDLISPS